MQQQSAEQWKTYPPISPPKMTVQPLEQQAKTQPQPPQPPHHLRRPPPPLSIENITGKPKNNDQKVQPSHSSAPLSRVLKQPSTNNNSEYLNLSERLKMYDAQRHPKSNPQNFDPLKSYNPLPQPTQGELQTLRKRSLTRQKSNQPIPSTPTPPPSPSSNSNSQSLLPFPPFSHPTEMSQPSNPDLYIPLTRPSNSPQRRIRKNADHPPTVSQRKAPSFRADVPNASAPYQGGLTIHQPDEPYPNRKKGEVGAFAGLGNALSNILNEESDDESKHSQMLNYFTPETHLKDRSLIGRLERLARLSTVWLRRNHFWLRYVLYGGIACLGVFVIAPACLAILI